MHAAPDSCFLSMIQTLRAHEEVLLFNDILTFTDSETDSVTAFLRAEHEREALEHPPGVPAFDASAALWSAQTVYVAAQLILYRRHEEKDVPLLMPPFSGVIDATAMLSADLCLRFLPDMIVQLKMMDTQDVLIPLLEDTLQRWHYSGVRHPLNPAVLDFAPVVADACLHQLYAQRIVEHRKLVLAELPAFKHTIAAQLGMYGAEFWNDFKNDTLPSLA